MAKVNVQFKEFVAAPQSAVANSFLEFIKEGITQGFTLMKPKGSETTVFLSKQGNPQMLFLDKEGQRLYIRVSANLDAALKAGEKVSIPDSPVYKVDLDNGGKMLVVGMAAEAQEFEAVDAKTAFGKYLVAEPS
jgi:hypothetical protein